jgi:hypothetical protein
MGAQGRHQHTVRRAPADDRWSSHRIPDQPMQDRELGQGQGP